MPYHSCARVGTVSREGGNILNPRLGSGPLFLLPHAVETIKPLAGSDSNAGEIDAIS